MRTWTDITPILPGEDSNPFWYMTYEQFRTGIDELAKGGLIMPYRIYPASLPNGEFAEAVCTSWARWKTYEWNPPEFMPVNAELLQQYGSTDFDASNKPRWQEIRRAYEKFSIKSWLSIYPDALKRECRSRITLAYGEDNLDDEILMRLRGENTAGQDIERDRLRAKCKVLVTGLNDLSVGDLENYDVSGDNLWGP